MKCVEESIDLIRKLECKGEVIFIDDCSTDKSVEKINLILNHNDIEVILVRNKYRSGCHKSVINGLLASKYHYVAWFPSDLQIRPSSGLEAIKLLQYFDVVQTFREGRQDNIIRIFLGKAWSYMCRKITRVQISDFDSNTFFTQPAISAIFRNSEEFISRNTGQSPEIFIRASQNGLKITEIGIEHYSRDSGSPNSINLKEIINSLIDLINLSKYRINNKN